MAHCLSTSGRGRQTVRHMCPTQAHLPIQSCTGFACACDLLSLLAPSWKSERDGIAVPLQRLQHISLFLVAIRALARLFHNLTETFKGISFQLHVVRIDRSDRRWRLPGRAFEDEVVIADDSNLKISRAHRLPFCYFSRVSRSDLATASQPSRIYSTLADTASLKLTPQRDAPIPAVRT